MKAPSAVVFLGNPGKEYELTRHNAGFLVSRAWPLAQEGAWQKKFKGEWISIPWKGRKVWLLRPATYMNLAGESVRAMGDFFQIGAESWVAVHDDIDLPFGAVKTQFGGGLGGHNGLRSLKAHLGTDQFYRLRVGIGRPVHGDVASFVLGRFTPDEEIELGPILDRAASALETVLEGGSGA